MPAALADRAPRVVTLDNGRETWVYEDGFYPQVGLNAVVGRPKEEWNMEPARFDEMRNGCYDIEARVADMDLDGVYASLCFPSLIAGFAGTVFSAEQGSGARPRRAAGLERLAHRGMGRSPSRTASSRCSSPGSAIRRSPPPTSGPTRPAVSRPSASRRTRSTSSCPRSTPIIGIPFLRACEETETVRLPPQRLVVVDRGPFAGRAARAVHELVPRQRAWSPRPTGSGRACRPASRTSRSRSRRVASAGCRC